VLSNSISNCFIKQVKSITLTNHVSREGLNVVADRWSVLLPMECAGRMTLKLGFKVPCILFSLSHLLDGNSLLVLKRKKKKEKKVEELRLL